MSFHPPEAHLIYTRMKNLPIITLRVTHAATGELATTILIPETARLLADQLLKLADEADAAKPKPTKKRKAK